MDFDHLSDKTSSINKLVTNGSMKKLLVEIAKCEIVCSNCHRSRTHARLVEQADTAVSNTAA